MDAVLIFEFKETFDDGTIAEIKVWRVPVPVLGSLHYFKYRLFFGVPGERLIGYDNERGKGDHRHEGGTEQSYRFTGPEELLRQFWEDVERWRAAYQDDQG
ncbi:MAG TPA: DUF6516 family protein [Devosiaceae bacterium]|nr:DUF6516 family protein [Devosiaceae bacterium]